MKTTIKTINAGYANNSDLFYSPNSTNDKFIVALKNYIEKNLNGFIELKSWDSLRGKNATEKVIIKTLLKGSGLGL